MLDTRPTPAAPAFRERAYLSSHLKDVPSNVHEKLRVFGLDRPAEEWLIRALHPAGGGESPPIPDQSLASVVLPDYRVSTVLSRPAGVVGDWDLLVYQAPGDCIAYHYAAGPAGVDFNGGITPANTYVGSETAQVLGFQPAMSIIPIVAGPPIAVASPLPESHPFKWRRRYGGLTCYLTASSVSDQGTVYAGTYAEGFEAGAVRSTGNTDPGGNYVMAEARTAFIPLDENSLQILTPKPYIAPARAGVYVPQRFIGPVAPFTGLMGFGGRTAHHLNTPVIADPTNVNSENGPPTMVTPRLIGATGGVSWITDAAAASNPENTLDTNYSANSQTVVIFRGLDPNATVTVRGYFGLEVIPMTDSPIRQFLKPASPFDPKAFQIYHMLAAEMAYAYPSSYNSWGSILGAISSVIGAVSPFLSFIPGVGPIAAGIGEAVALAGKGIAAFDSSSTARPAAAEVRKPAAKVKTITVAVPASKKKKKAVGKR